MPNNSIVSLTDSSDHLRYDPLSSEVQFENDEPWLTQAQMAELFRTTVQNVSLHVANFKKDDPSMAKLTIKYYLNVSNQKVAHYNIDVITYVGYKTQATEPAVAFRRWVASVLRERVKQQRQIAKTEYLRERTRLSNKLFNEKAQSSHHAHSPQYATLARTLDKSVFEINLAAVIEVLSLDEKESAHMRDHLTTYALSAIEDIEFAAAEEMDAAGNGVLHTKEQQAIIRKWAEHYAPFHKQAAELAGSDFVTGQKLLKDGNR